jgi:transposase
MFGLESSLVYQLYSKACDMRKSFDGLSGLVSHELGRDPLSGEVFIFLNRHRNLIKLLHWQPGGFMMYYKRLETGRFTLPVVEAGSRVIQWPALVLMIEGIPVKEYVQERRFKVEKSNFSG